MRSADGPRGAAPHRAGRVARVLSEPAVPLALWVLATCLFAWYGASRTADLLRGDEWRYLWYAENLLKGYYSPPEYVFLWGGPGYPLFLLPFVAAGASASVMHAANGVLLGSALLAFFLFTRQYASAPTAVACTALLALYLPIFDFLPLSYSEPLAFSLVCALLYTLSRAVQGSWTHVAAAGLVCGALVLTKVGFWPAIFGGCAISTGLCLWQRFVRRREGWRAYRNLALALFVGISCCVPYLLYTQRVTGRGFYWGAGTGSMLYWISNPQGQYYGEWFHQGWVEQLPELRKHHFALFERLGAYDTRLVGDTQGGERIARTLALQCSPDADDALKQAALENIRQHPGKYLRNIGYNTSRLLFDWPSVLRKFGATSRRLAAANGVVLAGVAFAVLRLLRRKRQLDASLLFLVWLFFSYLAMLSVVSAVGRYFVVIAPVGLGLFARVAASDLDRWFGASRSTQPDAR